MSDKPTLINGRYYPLWQQFVDKKAAWIGGVLEDHDMGICAKTTITDIRLAPNGPISAAFFVDGAEFGCGFDVQYGGVDSGEPGWITFHGYGGHTWRIKQP